jgi:hypothetical protein
MGIEGQAFQTDPMMSTLDVKEAMKRTQAQTQSPYEISPHGSHLAYDGSGTDFKEPTTQPVEWMGGFPSGW